MGNIIEQLRAKSYFHSLAGVTEDAIHRAEQELGLTFAPEYRDYLQTFGVASFQGHELTGIIQSPRLNVIEQTVSEKLKNPNIPNDLYVIEVANIDGIIIWQRSTGEIFQTAYDSPPVQICESLSEFIGL